MDERSRWGQVARNSLAMRMSFSRVNEASSFQARLSADLYWGTVVSSLFSSERKKSDNGWFLEVLDRDLGYEGPHQLELFKVDMVVICESMTPNGS